LSEEFVVPPAKKSTAVKKKTTAAKKTPAKKTTKTVRARKTAVASKRAPAKKLSASHKRALAAGRTEAHHVRSYLDALAAHQPRRGRQRTEATVRKQLAQVESELRGATGFRKLELAARRMELQGELASKQGRGDLSALRRNFVRHAGRYAARKGIPKKAFEEAGVPAADVRAARVK
jgi:hypothetical protein